MNRSRVTSAVLTCASLMALAACGGEGAPVTAGSTPSAPGSASPAAAPVSPAPSSAAPAGATGSTSDKKLCESAKKAGNDMKDAFATAAAQSVGMPSPAQMKKILTEFEKAMTASASAGGNSEVVTASKQISAAAAKAAAAADPTETAVSQGLQDAGAKLSTACKAAGVNIEF